MSIRYNVQHCLEIEGLSNETRSFLVFDPGGSTGYLRACPSGRVAHVALWGGFRLGARWYPRLEHFLAEG